MVTTHYDVIGLWDVEGVLRIMCCAKYRHKVEELAKTKVFRFSRRQDFWHWTTDAGLRLTIPELSRAWGFEDHGRIFVKEALTNEQAAVTLIHELVHTKQDPSMDTISKEVGAHLEEAQFAKDKFGDRDDKVAQGLYNPAFYDAAGNPASDAIRKVLLGEPGYNHEILPKGSEPGSSATREFGFSLVYDIVPMSGWDCSRVNH
jgi:hypothetical protein